MQLASIKISNLLSYPYRPNLEKAEGIRFYNRQENNVNILIGPNGAGKSGFLHILHQLFKVGLMNDYVCEHCTISGENSSHVQQRIRLYPQYAQGIHPHFKTPKKPSRVIIELFLTAHDYDNLRYISKNSDLFNFLIKKYSTLDIVYPAISYDDVVDIPASLTLDCMFDQKKNIFLIDEKKLSQQGKFVLLYLKTIELLQICIDLYNQYERTDTTAPLIPLKNGIAFIDTNRTLKNVSCVVNPRAWNQLIGNKNSVYHHAHVGFYLCAKKIRNIISDHRTLKMSKKDIANYPEKLKASEFYTSLAFVIKKYFDKTLSVEYRDGMLEFSLIDTFGRYLSFYELSDGEQSLLSMIFTMYGYDLKEGMIIIDEPEIHFHPQMQRSFTRMIEKINQNIHTQFIISTYSPLFINESNIGNVYRFSKINGETHVKNPFFTLSSDEASLVHLLKFENLSKIFFVNRIIMVEGETDAYFFEFYLRYLHTLPEWKPYLTDYEIININGKGSYKLWSKFLARFGLQSYFIGDRDNIVDYGFMTQNDLSYYYKQARSYYAGLKKSGKTHRHYNKLVDTIRNLFPQKYKQLLASIDDLYSKNVFILKKGDIETYLGMPEKGLEKTVKFCHNNFKQRLMSKHFDSCREEFALIFRTIFNIK